MILSKRTIELLHHCRKLNSKSILIEKGSIIKGENEYHTSIFEADIDEVFPVDIVIDNTHTFKDIVNSCKQSNIEFTDDKLIFRKGKMVLTLGQGFESNFANGLKPFGGRSLTLEDKIPIANFLLLKDVLNELLVKARTAKLKYWNFKGDQETNGLVVNLCNEVPATMRQEGSSFSNYKKRDKILYTRYLKKQLNLDNWFMKNLDKQKDISRESMRSLIPENYKVTLYEDGFAYFESFDSYLRFYMTFQKHID